MGTPIANLRRTDLPPLLSDVAFRTRFSLALDAGETLTFTAKPVELLFKPKTGATVSLTEADAGLTITDAGLTLTVSKPATWTTANLPVGPWKYTLYVGADATRQVFAFGAFDVIARGGA